MVIKNKSHHVVKNPSGGWSVKKGGASRASGTFRTQEDAINSARTIAKNQGTMLVIHGNDGRIKQVGRISLRHPPHVISPTHT